ncbi:MAG: hypothetical protein COA88_09705 [Kordia sp.]|nr:MAG: hypothetical protein COA88_09705 [Kordia sp.]
MNINLIIYNSFSINIKLKIWNCLFFFLFLSSCNEKEITLKVVSYTQFELFVNETQYITDAEKYGWSIVQIDVYNFKKKENANWKTPDGVNKVSSGELPVTQVSYNDALAYCKWAKKRLPSYNEYWELVKNDTRVIVSENKFQISEINKVNIVGNVWDITKNNNTNLIRLAGGSLFCSENTCHGTIRERELFVDKETGNIHIGFCVIDF